jgi:heme-degrading monooxygenase HmoA
VYTSSVFVVKKGREAEFVRRWEASASSLALEYPGVTFSLLRDHGSPRRFFSLGQGWRNLEQIDEARELPSFQDATAAMWRLLEAGENATLELVVEVS